MDRENDRTIGVPCGRCPNCLKRRASMWSFRLKQMEKMYLSSHFITMTYDTQHVPLTSSGYMSLDYRDVELFLKRLRKAQSGQKLKYFLVGEYGGKTDRPHYHAILFGVDITLIQNAWQKGSVHYGQVSGASIGYTLKYISKPGKIPIHQNDDRIKEQARMSKGLGLNYLSLEMINWHKAKPDRMYVQTEEGQKIAMPRYYKEKIYTQGERNTIGEIMRKQKEDQLRKEIAKYGDQYYRDKAENDQALIAKMRKQHFEGQTF